MGQSLKMYVSRTCSLMVHPAAGDLEDTELHALNRFRRS